MIGSLYWLLNSAVKGLNINSNCVCTQKQTMIVNVMKWIILLNLHLSRPTSKSTAFKKYTKIVQVPEEKTT